VPSQVLLVIDISGSMGQSMPTLRKAARGFLSALRPVDKVSVTAFNTGLFVLSSWEATAASRDAALERLRPWGGTAVYDSIIRATDLLKAREGRRVLVMFTDGDDIASRGSADSARTALQAHDVVLYMVAQGKAERDGALKQQLTDLAEDTGGRALFASRVGQLADQLSDVVEDVSKLYVIAYSPQRPLGDGQWRRIELEPVDKKLRIRARQGYFATRRNAGGGGRP
jgi:VWFA-related protein